MEFREITRYNKRCEVIINDELQKTSFSEDELLSGIVIDPYPIFEPLMLIPVNNTKAYTFSHLTANETKTYRLTQFKDPAGFVDGMNEGDITWSMVSQTRYLYADEDRKKIAKPKKVTIFIDFDDTDGLTITFHVDGTRLTASCTYSQTRQSGMGNTGATIYRDLIEIFCPEEIRAGKHFDIKVSKVVPTDGDVELFGQELTIYEGHEEEEEFFDTLDSASGAMTFVVEADASPEVDAYA